MNREMNKTLSLLSTIVMSVVLAFLLLIIIIVAVVLSQGMFGLDSSSPDKISSLANMSTIFCGILIAFVSIVLGIPFALLLLPLIYMIRHTKGVFKATEDSVFMQTVKKDANLKVIVSVIAASGILVEASALKLSMLSYLAVPFAVVAIMAGINLFSTSIYSKKQNV